MLIKKIIPLALVMPTLFACVPEIQYASVSLTPQFDLANYTEVPTSDTDLTGAWITLLAGTRNETNNSVDFRTQGFIREVVQITEETPGVFYARACTKAEEESIVTIDGDNVSFTVNNLDFSLTKSDFKNMAGSAATTENGVSYTPSVAMKKIAAPGATFGNFLFRTVDTNESRTADCFHESNLAVTGVAGFITQTSYLETFNATDHDGIGEYDQTAYVFQYNGTVSPRLKTITFVDGVDGSGPNASREGEQLARSKVAVNADNFDVDITGNDISATGAIDIVIP